MIVDRTRITPLSNARYRHGKVIYWMNRDQRIDNNWALIYAVQLAREKSCGLAVVFCLAPDFPGANIRHYDFMLRSLKHEAERASALNIPFIVLDGDPVREMLSYIAQENIGFIVTDFSPLRVALQWKRTVAEQSAIPVIEVDAHNIVPCRFASSKREYSAATFRKKVTPLLEEYLTPFPVLKAFPPQNMWEYRVPDWNRLEKTLRCNADITPVTGIEPGIDSANTVLDQFILHGLPNYHNDRNDPTKKAVSGLSPYLHFGQISAQAVAFRINNTPGIPEEAAGAFLEELIIRRELSDNFCLYESEYDNFDCLHDWSKKTLDDHRDDPREYVYDYDAFDRANTHDPLWNAAQKEMIYSGKMHGYMRMYWAKKILEWSASPEDAIEFAIRLNDTYELDGRDPNGYVGVLWSIGGLHDRAWSERPIFGKIRYMNANGCRRKFDTERYCRYVDALVAD